MDAAESENFLCKVRLVINVENCGSNDMIQVHCEPHSLTRMSDALCMELIFESQMKNGANKDSNGNSFNKMLQNTRPRRHIFFSLYSSESQFKNLSLIEGLNKY